jgi:hygromycin-B 4-O-kinase
VVGAAGAAAFLRARFGQGAGEVEPVGQGEWSQAFFFRQRANSRGPDGAMLPAGRYVVRFSALLEDFAKDRLARQYAAPALPIPRVAEVGACADVAGGGVLEAHYAVSERLDGEYIDGVNGDQMRALLPALFAALDAMRLADLTGTSGYGSWGADGVGRYPSWRETLLELAEDRPDERIHGWRAALEASPTGVAPFDEAFRTLQQLAAHVPEERHLIHSDLLHYNVLVRGPEITAVLDWGCGLYGDFLYDVAWFCFWQPWFPAWNGIDFAEEARRHYAAIGLHVPDFETRLRACQLHIGLSGQAYQAYRAYWDDLEATARRTLEVERGGR